MEPIKLMQFNDWWLTKSVKPGLLMPKRRKLYFDIQKYIKNRQILLITGLRRVGKTTLMYQLIQHLIETNVDCRHILYFSFDEETKGLDDVVKTYEDIILKKNIMAERIYIFLDEVQKLHDWQNRIKIYYDLYPNIKFIVSGSASVQINKRAKESLAGRIFDFLLEPLSFREFIEWKEIKVDMNGLEVFGKSISPIFHDFLRKGGFPELVDENDDEKIRSYIKGSVVDRIIYKDLPEEFGIKDFDLLKTLIEMVARQPGIIVNYDSLSKNLQKNKRTIMDYFFYLEYALLIRELANYREGFIISSRKMKKAYLANTAISFAFVEDFYASNHLERLAENFAVIEANAKNYHRNKYEVDIILKIKNKLLPVEIKYGKAMEIEPMYEFMKLHHLKEGIILSKDTFDEKKNIKILPLWAFALSKEKYLGK